MYDYKRRKKKYKKYDELEKIVMQSMNKHKYTSKNENTFMYYEVVYELTAKTISDKNKLNEIFNEYTKIYNTLIEYRNVNIGTNPIKKQFIEICKYSNLKTTIHNSEHINKWNLLLTNNIINKLCFNFYNDNLKCYTETDIYGLPYRQLPNNINYLSTIQIDNSVVIFHNKVVLLDTINLDISKTNYYENEPKNNELVKITLTRNYNKYYLVLHKKTNTINHIDIVNDQTVIYLDHKSFIRDISNNKYPLGVNLNRVFNKIVNIKNNKILSNKYKNNPNMLIKQINTRLEFITKKNYIKILNTLVRNHSKIFVDYTFKDNKDSRLLNIEFINDLYMNIKNRFISRANIITNKDISTNQRYIGTISNNNTIYKCNNCKYINIVNQNYYNRDNIVYCYNKECRNVLN